MPPCATSPIWQIEGRSLLCRRQRYHHRSPCYLHHGRHRHHGHHGHYGHHHHANHNKSTKSGIPHLPINDVDQGGGNLLASPKRKMAKVSENKPHNVLELLSTIIITSIIIMKYYIACIAMCEVVKPNETDSVLYFPVVVSYHVEQYS